MNATCTDIRELFDDLLDNALPLPARDLVQQHLTICADCRAALAQEQTFRRLLRSHQVPPMSDGFAARALASARHSDTHLQRRGFAAGFASAVAMLMLLGAGVMLFSHRSPVPGAIPTVMLALAQPQTVRLVFTAPQNFPDATLTVALPRNIQLEGYPGKRRVVWRSSLYKGRNLLALPLVAGREPSGDLVATIRYGTEVKTFQLRLKAQPPRQSMTDSVTV